MISARSATPHWVRGHRVDVQQISPRADIEAADTYTAVLPEAAVGLTVTVTDSGRSRLDRPMPSPNSPGSTSHPPVTVSQ
jgi:hypothetical protein